MQVNDSVYVHCEYSGYRKGTIVKITPSGLVDVQLEQYAHPLIRFKNGKERMGNKYNPYTLQTDVAAIEELLAKKQIQIEKYKVMKEIYDLSQAHVNHSNYEINEEVKNKFQELVNKL